MDTMEKDLVETGPLAPHETTTTTATTTTTNIEIITNTANSEDNLTEATEREEKVTKKVRIPKLVPKRQQAGPLPYFQRPSPSNKSKYSTLSVYQRLALSTCIMFHVVFGISVFFVVSSGWGRLLGGTMLVISLVLIISVLLGSIKWVQFAIFGARKVYYGVVRLLVLMGPGIKKWALVFYEKCKEGINFSGKQLKKFRCKCCKRKKRQEYRWFWGWLSGATIGDLNEHKVRDDTEAYTQNEEEEDDEEEKDLCEVCISTDESSEPKHIS